MPPKKHRTTPSFQDTQQEVWEKLSKKIPRSTQDLPPAALGGVPNRDISRDSSLKAGDQMPTKKPETKLADWQVVWDLAQPPSYSFAKTQDESRSKDNHKVAVVDIDDDDDDDDDDEDYDAAKPAVDYQSAWNAVLLTDGMTEDAGKSIEKGKGRRKETVSNGQGKKISVFSSDTDSSTSSRPAFAPPLRIRSPSPTPPTPPKKFTVFTDSPSLSSSSKDTMFQRYRIVPKEKANTVLGLEESWYLVKEEDANEGWEMTEGADVEDDWDTMPEADRFTDGAVGTGSGSERRGWNWRMREFLEKQKRERIPHQWTSPK